MANLVCERGLSDDAAVCMSHAARNAWSASRNWHTTASPSVLMTMPSCEAVMEPSFSNSVLMSASAGASPSDSYSAVLSQTSANNTARCALSTPPPPFVAISSDSKGRGEVCGSVDVAQHARIAYRNFQQAALVGREQRAG